MKLPNCSCFFFIEVYFEAPKMCTKQLNKVFNGVHFFSLYFYQKYAFLQVLFKIFAQIWPEVIYKEIFDLISYELLFPKKPFSSGC